MSHSHRSDNHQGLNSSGEQLLVRGPEADAALLERLSTLLQARILRQVPVHLLLAIHRAEQHL